MSNKEFLEKVTIIVAAYNAEQTISHCLDSLMRQTYEGLQIIVVDDGSTDKTFDICKSVSRNDPRIEVLHQDNGGQATAIRQGLKHIKGKYVGFVDSDDYVELNMYELLKKAVDETGADYVHSQFYDNEARYKTYPTLIDVGIDREAFILEHILDVENRMIASKCTNLYKTEFIQRVYKSFQYDKNWAEDAMVMIVGSLLAKKIAFLNTGFYHYNIYDGSESRRYDIDKVAQVVSWYEEIERIFKLHNASEKMFFKLKEYYKYHLMDIYKSIFGRDFYSSNWTFIDTNYLRGKKVAIYGAGSVGKDFFFYLRTREKCDIAAWVDKNWEEKEQLFSVDITAPDTLEDTEFDYLVIAVADENVANSIKYGLIDVFHIDADVIKWARPLSPCRII